MNMFSAGGMATEGLLALADYFGTDVVTQMITMAKAYWVGTIWASWLGAQDK